MQACQIKKCKSMTLITKIEYVALSGIELGAGKSFIYKKKYYEWQTSTVSLVLCAR
jgi:hypothetical protein